MQTYAQRQAYSDKGRVVLKPHIALERPVLCARSKAWEELPPCAAIPFASGKVTTVGLAKRRYLGVWVAIVAQRKVSAMNDDMRIGALEAGGTKMVLAVGAPDGTILEQEELPTTEPATCVERIASWFSERSIDALGVGAFGPTGVNPASSNYGFVLDTPKLAWKGFDFRGALARALGVPVGYDTDVNAACLGEATFGCARGLDAVVYLTVGTGIGAGVMVGGELLHGMLHPEAGHISVVPRTDDAFAGVCPYHGTCLEGMAAGPAIEERWGAPAVELAGRSEVWELEAHYLAQGLATYVLCYSPQRIILGGGVMHQEQLFPLVREQLLKNLSGYISAPELADVDSYVVPSSLGGRQGILGALELGRRAAHV